MTWVPLLTGLAIRELWTSFRLVGLLVVLLATAAPAALVGRTAPGLVADGPPGPLSWYALASAGALAVGAGAAAWSLATMRRRGIAAWLAARGVPRPSLALAWFGAIGLVVLVGFSAAAAFGWLALGGSGEIVVAWPAFGATAGAVCAAGLLAIAAGLVAGSLAGVRVATLLAAVVVLVPSMASAAGWLGDAPQPLGGLASLARLEIVPRPVAAGLGSAGLALALAAGLLVVASAALDRRDL